MENAKSFLAKKFYCVKQERNLGLHGKESYHSVYTDYKMALKQAALRNKLHGKEYKYFVVEATPKHVAWTYTGKPVVKFADSVGFVSVNIDKY